ADASLPVAEEWLQRLKTGDAIHLEDTRGASRKLRVVAADREGCWVESARTCYVSPGTILRTGKNGEAETRVGALPAGQAVSRLAAGDELILARSEAPGRDALRDERGRVLSPATVGCTADRIFEDAKTGDGVWLDDGKIGGMIERSEPDRLQVRITRT